MFCDVIPCKPYQHTPYTFTFHPTGFLWSVVTVYLCSSSSLTLGHSLTGLNAKDYFTGYTRYHGSSRIFWIKHGWIPSQGVPQFYQLAFNAGAFLHAKEAFATTWCGQPLLANRPCKSKIRTVLYTITTATTFNAAA